MTWQEINRIFVLVFFSSVAALASGQAEQSGSLKGESFQVEKVVGGLGVPWGMAELPDRKLLITERGGSLKSFDLVSRQLTKVAGVPEVYAVGQGGLLDVAIPPGYRSGDPIYFTYSKAVRGQGVTVLASARLKAGRLENWKDLLVTESRSDTGRHFGSRIAFDNSGHVFFSVGDRGVRDNGQNLDNHAGTVLRLNLAGSIPADNPFAASSGTRAAIWSYGHRNPQGLAFDSEASRLWEIEHGPRGGDEINLIEAGRNYGWPVISYGKEYWGPFDVGEGTEKSGMEQPVQVYVPSIAPGSLMFYSGSAFPRWRGLLFAGALKLTHLNVVELNQNAEAISEFRLLESMGQRIRALVQSREGWIYFSTDRGDIYVIRPKAKG